MRGVNKAIIVGNVGSDPDIRYTQSGAAVVNFSVATNERWKDDKGETQERTEWHRVVAFGTPAEFVAEYLKKGAVVYVEGKIKTEQWEKDGERRYTTKIHAFVVNDLGSAGSGKQGGGRRQDAAAYRAAKSGEGDPPVEATDTQLDRDDDGGIPF